MPSVVYHHHNPIKIYSSSSTPKYCAVPFVVNVSPMLWQPRVCFPSISVVFPFSKCVLNEITCSFWVWFLLFIPFTYLKKEMKAHVHTNTCMWIFIAVIFIIAKKTRNNQNVKWWIDKLTLVLPMDKYSMRKLLVQATYVDEYQMLWQCGLISND